MDSQVIEFDIGVGGGGDDDGVDIEHHVDDEEMVDSPPLASGGGGDGSFGGGIGGSGEIYLPEGDLLDLEPYEGMEFESEEAAKAFYNSYARRVGFSTRVSSSRRSRRDGAIIQRQFVCAKEGFRNLNEKRTKDREIKRPRMITRVGCKASLSVKMQDSGKWVVSGFVKEHNHELVPPDQVHCLRSHRQISGPAKTKLFMRFQEELVGTLTLMASKAEDDGDVITYQVSKYGEDHRSYYVKFNVLEMKATCSCQMFEFSGLLCRHVLAVFRVTNVLTLPSHYVMKRWTRNAKSSVLLEEHCSTVYNNYLESHTVRYNTLRHEAFKYVDEGAKSPETYDAAICALREAVEKVAHALKNNGKNPVVNGRVRGNPNSTIDACGANHSASRDRQGSSGQHMSEDEMDKRIQELTSELESANRKCEIYRANLLSVLKDIEDHKLQLSIKVQNVKISMKDESLEVRSIHHWILVSNLAYWRLPDVYILSRLDLSVRKCDIAGAKLRAVDACLQMKQTCELMYGYDSSLDMSDMSLSQNQV
ncbi:hypothetical protein TIFTF001_019306 [Ficus carica]|uniref:Protein FAR1-RELATED SEQUENCE n=1 Tax=Ficus carica TaxID=3494 RepID=A0AA88AG27_FICCA|nr:hypothetical protein TIFTF001_019306 [Ficus carica]